MENNSALQLTNKNAQLSFNEIISIANAFAASGMFPDIKSGAQAIVKIQAGQELGIKPFAAMSGIHIIAGKCVPGAGIIASRVKANTKYDYKVIEMSDEKCSLDFYEGKDFLGNSSFTIADAKKAGTKNTDKFPKNMLFARAISNGAKWFTPDVFDMPVYVEEEMGFATEDVKSEIVAHPESQESIKPDSISTPEIKADHSDTFVIPGLWYAKMEKCQSKADVLELYKKNKETVDAHPELQQLLKETQNKFSSQN